MSEMQGSDVSKWQGQIDWAEAAKQIGFAMVKATQGTSEVDPDYAANIAALREMGEHRGSYHYPDAGDPVQEADFYVLHAGRRNGEMQALDFEGAVLNLPDPVGWAQRWLQRVIDRTGNRPLIYMSGSTEGRFDWSRVIALNVGLWQASWDVSGPAKGQWPFTIMWQRDDTGHLAGIAGNVDQDVFYGDANTWAQYANNFTDPAPAAPQPPPAPRPVPAPAPVTAPPAPPDRPAPAEPQPATAYTVRPGDTLSGIAAAHGLNWRQLAAANTGRYPSLGWNPDYLQVGWTLALPGEHPAEHGHVTVQAGDTLSGIAAEHGDTLAQVEQANPQITDPNRIYPGESVNLP